LSEVPPARGRPAPPQGRLWLTVCSLLALGMFAGALAPSSWWSWQPALAASEPWRWWTAAFVHFSGAHFTGNLMALAAVALFGRAARVPAALTLAWLAAWPLTHLALLARPDLPLYGGLSGVLHAGVAVSALFVARRGVGTARRIGWIVLIGLAVKVAWETPWGPTLREDDWTGVPVVPWVHAAGLLAGLFAAMLALARDGSSGDRE
jgi:rhomboid family GlyGly-CTERM serine protease